ncbi:ABC transporter transmembrane domain-containing protein [Brevibacillus centrosporus]|uniref:ABC transporter ATP-binding protein n=1 Tax=Brevibacillus centrosporus TaxID=54910 RepID=UPI000F09FF95|nr:ABC transporter transmembrane domain-containing protein [Brevibacillus centrosporus]MEC2129573.1 ABC transporter transmembrane domain-containing protein [Brevibacillus centrosporus]RNB65440.1 ATP-binding cassette domain-containing protein [Brevibacillus centrosporus]GED29927.1 multidrug ABC transporter permease/ATP-binding protein [Brevibacillus centrosporus]
MFSVLTKLNWFFREHRKQYIIAISLLILGGILEVVPPKIVGIAIDELQMGTMTAERLGQIVMGYAALAVFLYLVNLVWVNKLFGGAYLAERSLRSKLMTHFLKMTPTFYQKNRTGDLMARATNDLKAVSMTTGFGILTLVDSASFTSVIILTMGFFVSWKLTLASILPLPFMAYAIHRYGKKIHERFSQAQDAFGELNDQVLESVAGVRVVRAYVQETADEKRFRTKTREVYEKNIAVAKVDSLIEPTVKILVGICYMIGLIYGGYLVFHQELTLGELISFNVYLGMLIWPMFAIGELINIMQRGSASLDRVNETLAYPADVTDHAQPVSPQSPETICFDRVTFRYPSAHVESLREVSFTLQRGQTLGIVGRTGSGKTTLVRQLLREFPLGTGSISIAGTPVERIPLDQLKRWIGYVPQEQILFSKTVRENVLLGKKEGTEEDLQEALRLAAFAKDVKFLQGGVETLVGERGVALSGGQKQRVSIARALLVQPEILILDDAMSAVDGKTEAEMIANIRRERSGKTTLITTHRLSAVKHADWILVLEDGKIVEEGTHEQLIELGGWYKEQYVLQQMEAQLTEGE